MTETQIESNTDFTDRQFDEMFDVIHNIDNDKYCSIATCLKRPSIHLLNIYQVPSAMLITIKKDDILNPINIMLLYRKQSLPMQEFMYIIRHLSDHVDNEVHIILGDFNIDAYNNRNIALQEILQQYKMIVNDPTHLSGSLLDHVYIRNDLLEMASSIECIVKCIFFSDHDAVKFKLVFA